MHGLSAVDGHRVFVRAEPKGCPVPDAATLRAFFEQYGEVHDIYIPVRTPDVCYITFKHAKSLDQLLGDLPNKGLTTIGTQTCTVAKAMPRGSPPPAAAAPAPAMASNLNDLARLSALGGVNVGGGLDAQMAAALGVDPNLLTGSGGSYGADASNAMTAGRGMSGSGGSVGLQSGGTSLSQSPSCRIYVVGAVQTIGEEALRAHFGQFGFVKDVYIPVDRASGLKKPFCFITMNTPEEQQRVLALPTHQLTEQISVNVTHAEPRGSKGDGKAGKGGGGHGDFSNGGGGFGYANGGGAAANFGGGGFSDGPCGSIGNGVGGGGDLHSALLGGHVSLAGLDAATLAACGLGDLAALDAAGRLGGGFHSFAGLGATTMAAGGLGSFGGLGAPTMATGGFNDFASLNAATMAAGGLGNLACLAAMPAMGMNGGGMNMMAMPAMCPNTGGLNMNAGGMNMNPGGLDASGMHADSIIAVGSNAGNLALGPCDGSAPQIQQAATGDHRIIVSGMPDGLNADMLRGHFSRHGDLVDIYIPVRSPDMAYVAFANQLEMQDALVNSGLRIAGFHVKEISMAPSRGGQGIARGNGARVSPY